MEESVRRRSGAAGLDYTLALTPALSPRRGAGVRVETAAPGCWRGF